MQATPIHTSAWVGRLAGRLGRFSLSVRSYTIQPYSRPIFTFTLISQIEPNSESRVNAKSFTMRTLEEFGFYVIALVIFKIVTRLEKR